MTRNQFYNNQENLPSHDPASIPKGRGSEQGEVFPGGNLRGKSVMTYANRFTGDGRHVNQAKNGCV